MRRPSLPAAAALAWSAAAAVSGAAPAAEGPMSTGGSAAAASAAASDAAIDVTKLFAGTCGWCHADGGRIAGKGPQLMGTSLTDEQIVYRVRNGKQGAMPSFKGAFDDQQLQAIVAYIRGLKPEGSQ